MNAIVTRNAAKCSQCGDKIVHNGNHWEHVSITPRHMAKPEKSTMYQESVEVDVEEYLS